MPELLNIATGKESRAVQLEEFSAAFSISDEKKERAAGQETETDATGALFGQP
jgi:hypothetical protein